MLAPITPMHEPDEQHQERDPGGVAGGDEELAEEAVRGR